MIEDLRVPVKEVCTLIVDCVNRTAPIQDAETPFKMIRTTNIRDGRIDLTTCRYVNNETYERWTRRAKLLDGDVLLTREAPIGEVGYVSDLGSAFLGQRIMQYRPDPRKIVPRYLYYAFRSSDLQHQFGSHDGSGSVVSHIRVADCHEFEITIPRREQQVGVVELLGSLDDKIELNRRMNETLEGMAQALFKDWFVDFSPVRRKISGESDPLKIMGGLITSPAKAATLAALFPTSFGDDGLPEGWENIPYSSLIKIIGGGTPKTKINEYWGGEIPWFSVVDTPNGSDTFVFETEKAITIDGLNNSSARLISAETTIITARGTVGNLAIAAREMTFNQSCYALQSSDGNYPYFIFLSAKHVVSQLKTMAHGSVFSTITRQTFENIIFPKAPTEVFEAFEEYAKPLFDRIGASVDESRTLAQTRDYLLPKLMSGQIRVRDVEKLVGEA